MIDETIEKSMKEAKTLFEAIKWGKQHGLETEFLMCFLEEFKQGVSVDDAIWSANCEWDL